MKFKNCILINFVTDARTDAPTHGQVKSNMPLQLYQKCGHNKTSHTREPKGQPSPAGDYQAAMNRPENKTDTKYK